MNRAAYPDRARALRHIERQRRLEGRSPQRSIQGFNTQWCVVDEVHVLPDELYVPLRAMAWAKAQCGTPYRWGGPARP